MDIHSNVNLQHDPFLPPGFKSTYIRQILPVNADSSHILWLTVAGAGLHATIAGIIVAMSFCVGQ
jgi:Na+/H+ antiporter NhaA